MKCIACDVALTDAEATRKDDVGFVDLCNECYYAVYVEDDETLDIVMSVKTVKEKTDLCGVFDE